MTKPDASCKVPELRFPEFRDAGEWVLDAIGEEVDLLSGYPFDGVEISENPKGTILLRGINITEGVVRHNKEIDRYFLGDISKIEKYKTEIDDLVIAMDGSKVGKNVALITLRDKGALLVQRVARLRAKRSISTQFLFQKINSISFQNYVDRINTSSGIPHISARQINEFEIHFPQISEQQKIADCLASLDELITAEAQQLTTLKAHKKGLMQQLFPAEGETLPKLRFPEFRDAGEWDVFTLGQMGKFRRGSFPQPYGLPEWFDDENGYPFIQVYDVGNDLQLKPKTKSKISKLAAAQSVFIPKETLIVTLQGSIGRVAITQYDAYIDRTLLIFEEFFKPTDKMFFAFTIQNLFEIEKEKAPGGIIKTITKEVLTDFKIKHPTLPEQQKIANCLSSLDDLIATQTQKLATLKAHKKGLMQQLFPSADEVQE
jgi:type I restriction enzyme S subunit